MPAPPGRPKLRNDDWLDNSCRKADSVRFIEQQLKRRRQLEAQHKEFTFAPLITTLKNMQLFIRHIRSGAQFRAPLTPGEHEALALLEKQTATLVQAEAPYKRTVQLAMKLLAVCEELTDTRVLNPLEEQQPAFFDQYCLRLADPGSMNKVRKGDHSDASPDSDDLWVGGIDFTSYLNNTGLLLYPSFQSLELGDFCRSGHLAMHPVGMITTYAHNADGLMRSPLTFAMHDLGHMITQGAVGSGCAAPGLMPSVLQIPCWRLAWRQLLLDKLPQRPPFEAWQPALTLLLFQLFHELNPSCSLHYLDTGYSAFLGCLHKLARVRRHDRAGYSNSFRQVTDTQAAMAALWTVRLWERWQAAGGKLTADQLDSHAQRFMAVEAPGLQQHLHFIAQHRGALRQLFTDNAQWIDYQKDSQRTVIHALADGVYRRQPLILFDSSDPRSGLCHLDNTDLAYFSALRSPRLRRKIQQKTGTSLPADLLFESSTPALGTATLEA